MAQSVKLVGKPVIHLPKAVIQVLTFVKWKTIVK